MCLDSSVKTGNNQENTSPQEHSNPTTVGTKNCNIAEAQDKYLKIFDYDKDPFWKK